MSVHEKQPEENVRLVLADQSGQYFRNHSAESLATTYKVCVKLVFFFRDRTSQLQLDNQCEHGFCVLRYDEQYDEGSEETVLPLTGFKSAQHAQPELVFGCLAQSMHCLLVCEGVSMSFPRVFVRLAGFPYTIGIGDIKSGLVGRFVSVCGTVTGVSSIRPLVQSMSFECTGCKAHHSMIFVDGQYVPPVSCDLSGCKSRYFLPLRNTVDAEDWQHARLQESMDFSADALTPSAQEIEVRNDQVDTLRPGQAVTLTGIVKSRRSEGAKSSKSLFVLYLDVNYILNVAQEEDLKPTSASSTSSTSNTSKKYIQRERLLKLMLPCFSSSSSMLLKEAELVDLLPLNVQGVDFFYKDFLFFHKVAGQQFECCGYGVPQLLVSSFCPSQFGLHSVKLGQLQGLLGGSKVHEGHRNDIHVLLVGEPGLGKSQLLRVCASLAVKGVYLSGNMSTASGLTASVHREKRDSAYSLEPGALVICDQGVCCIDEQDKMGAEQIALLEAMEQQTVSLSKAGVIASLPARATVIAAANPKRGIYDKSKTLLENVKIASPQQNRFDQSFLLIDKTDEDKDKMLARHIVGMYGNANTTTNNNNNNNNSNLIMSNNNTNNSILDYIKQSNSQISALPFPLLRRYIIFARECIKPVFSQEARQPLQDFFLNQREKGRNQQGLAPITTRQLESLIRLCEARAKQELRSVITKQDAEDVIALFSDTLYKQLIDDHGVVDQGRNVRGTSAATGNHAGKLLTNQRASALRSQQEQWHERHIKEIGRSMGLTNDQIDRSISCQNQRGDILYKGSSSYSIPSLD